MDRFGSDDIFENIGATLLISSVIFGVIIIIILLVVKIYKSKNNTEEGRIKIQKCRRMIFFNPIIRYCLLNTLKFNMLAILTLFGSELVTS